MTEQMPQATAYEFRVCGNIVAYRGNRSETKSFCEHYSRNATEFGVEVYRDGKFVCTFTDGKVSEGSL